MAREFRRNDQRARFRAALALTTILFVCATARAQSVVAVAPDGRPITFLTPLGVDPPTDGRASASAFRVVASLPPDLDVALVASGSELRLAIESEVAPNVATPQTLGNHPRSALRTHDRSGAADPRPMSLLMRHAFPAELRARLKFQRGASQFESPVIIAIADPRASIHYAWPAGADKRAAGCFNCERPAALQGKTENDGVFELFTSGGFVAIRPDSTATGNVFTGTPYAYLGQSGRMELRVPTVPADVVHPPSVRIAANAPPIADGLLAEETYLHSGELGSEVVDLDAGGRAGWNVVVGRTYRSRSIGDAPFGAGWDSTLFRRLRALPNGDVEYRDGGGEVWLFRSRGDGTFIALEGLFLALTRESDGFTLVDQESRVTRFDALGRLASESDEFFDPARPGSGNTIRYVYDSEGRLERILDPVGRQTTVIWDRASGLVQEIADWHTPPRKVTYEYDAQRRLARVDLPAVANQRPRIEYGYLAGGTTLNEQLETAPNLTSITDPGASAPRITFRYADDRVIGQQWATGESATFTYNAANSVTVKDVLGEERRYTLTTNDTTNLLADRAHITEERELGVPVWSSAVFGQLPTALTPGAPAITTTDRTRAFAFENGVLISSKLEGVNETTFAYQPATGAPGLVMKATTTAPLVSGGGGASSFIPASPPITRTFVYQPGSNFLEAVEAGGKRIESAEPHRKNTAPATTNSEITTAQAFDATGLLTATTSTGGTDSTSAGAKSRIAYWSDTAPLHARGLPHFLREGDGADELVTKIEYPSETQTKETDPRGVVTTTDSDPWQRPMHMHVERPGDPLVLDQTFEYDDAGRLTRTSEKKGPGEVVTSFTYDLMGRRTSTTTNGIATVGSITTTTAYNLAARTVTTTHAGGAVTTTELDPLGHVKRSVTETGSSPIEQQFAYDLAGHRVYATDMRTASASTFDAHGRVVATRAADGTIATTELDEWSRPITVRSLTDDGSSIVAESSYDFTAAGRLKSMTAKIDVGIERTTAFAWDGGGRTTRAATNGRASAATFDLAGRMKTSAIGAGSIGALTEVFERSEITAYEGELPAAAMSSEKNGASYIASMDRNTTGEVVRENVGPLEWKSNYDELGNVTEASVPGRPPTKWNVDARGAVEKETLPDGAENAFAYHASGAQTGYSDPTNEATNTVTDLIGRPLTRTYPDGTTERIEWDGSRVKSVTDRQNRKQSYDYNAKGQLVAIRDETNAFVDRLAYDNAGRLVSWTNADSEIAWSNFDLDGNPKQTTQRRFRNASGFSTTPIVLDELAQEHRWNEHGERVRFSMPVSPGVVLGAGWTKWIAQTFDALGNVISIARAAGESSQPDPPLMTASHRGAGRPDVRTVFTSGNPIVRSYAYDPASSLLARLEVSAGGVPIAGSDVAYDGLQKSATRLLGISSNERFARFAYDDRSRLTASVFGTREIAPPIVPLPGRAREQLSPADFREAQERTPQLDSSTASLLATKAIDVSTIDPPSSTFEEKPGGGHKIAKATKGPLAQPFGYDGAERIDDGRFTYTFDAKGRLIRATGKANVPPIRRVIYNYSGTGRLLGRRAEYATVASPAATDWKLEDRPPILAAAGLPAETTFAWDPISDRLLAIYRAGATGDPIKQILHGDAAYDDPLETTTLDPLTGAVTHLYPIYDEAGAGSLQAVLNVRGEVVARNLTNDPYGSDDVALAGAAIDGVSITARKDESGAIERVDVTMHATEQVASSSLPSAARLAAIDANGAVVRIATTLPMIAADDPYAVHWILNATQWSALVDPASVSINGTLRIPFRLSIAATKDLRATAWSGSIPVMPAPEWATASKPIYTSPDLPVEVRESLSSLSSYLAGISPSEERTTHLYQVETLGLLGVNVSDTPLEEIVSARMHAHPFVEPLTQLDYVRARWYDPITGSFLIPDPEGNADSPNLYSFCGGDPVNKSDPTGERIATAADKAEMARLAGRIASYQQDWVRSGRARFTDYRYAAIPGLYRSSSEAPLAYLPFDVEAATSAQYQRGLALLQNDLASFESAVARADDDGSIFYIPNLESRGYATRTHADEASARRWAIAVNVGLYASDVIPSWFAPTHVEPVTELSGGGARAQIRVSDLDAANLRYPHGNIKDSGLPAEGYSIRSRRTGEVLKYGETTRGEQRYSRRYFEAVDARLVFETSGTKAEMHEWQHQKILEYKAAHGGKRPPFNKSDY